MASRWLCSSTGTTIFDWRFMPKSTACLTEFAWSRPKLQMQRMSGRIERSRGMKVE
jgi:hypothetical protein